MNKYLLSICIPTYNCKDRIVSIVKRYLRIPDDRFCIRIVDNKSTDGTYEALSSIQDPRLIVSQNTQNIGFQKNSIKVLSGAPAKYIIYSIDKDYFSEKYLIEFMERLISDSPNFGYVTLKYDSTEEEKCICKAGVNAILNSGAFVSRHPTGFFFRSGLFNIEISKDIYGKLEPNFAFPFDMVFGSLASEYDVTLYNIPLTIHPDELIHTTKTVTYNEDNFFFNAKYRIIAYEYYLHILMESSLTLQEKSKIESILFYRLLIDVSLNLNSYYNDKLVCEHYNLRMRDINTIEMIHNTFKALNSHCKSCRKYRMNWFTINTIHSVIRVHLKVIKNLIKKIWNLQK